MFPPCMHLGIASTATDIQLIFTQLRQSSTSGKMAPENAVVSLVTIPMPMVAQLIAGLNTAMATNKAITDQMASNAANQPASGIRN
jgi:hypothetical protein